MHQGTVKNYYKILGVTDTASTYQIERSYQKLITKWHPERNKQNKEQAQIKFNQVNEAFEVLSNRNSRSHYDQIFKKGYSLQDAQSTFSHFLQSHDFINEHQKQFFEAQNKNKGKKIKNYYQVLELPNTATLEDIKTAYRTFALKYHPKNNIGSQQAVDKFLQISQAYKILSDQKIKDIHQTLFLRPFEPFRSHSIFQDYFGIKPFDYSFDSEIEPTLKKRWSRTLDRLMDDQLDLSYVSNGETFKESTVYTRQNDQETRKTVRSKIKIQNGQVQQVKIEQYLYPNGEREVIRTVSQNGTNTKSTYHLKKGEQLPKQLSL